MLLTVIMQNNQIVYSKLILFNVPTIIIYKFLKDNLINLFYYALHTEKIMRTKPQMGYKIY
jgi:hypothetical protein